MGTFSARKSWMVSASSEMVEMTLNVVPCEAGPDVSKNSTCCRRTASRYSCLILDACRSAVCVQHSPSTNIF
jgi:hypothetical protein